jgi:Emfourin
MRLTIRRVGGQLPTFQPARVMTDGDLDAATAEIARSFVRAPPAGGSAPQPDSFRYIFELEDDGGLATASASFAEVPEELRALLPTPTARRD